MMQNKYAQVCCVVFALLCVVRVIADETYIVKQMHFLPPTHYVGDLVEVRLRIDVVEGILPAEPTEFPEPGTVAIYDVRVIPISGEYDVRISFSSFHPGTRMLPQITLGKLVIKDIRIQTNSLIEDRNLNFVGVFDPVYLPGSRLLLALAIGALLILPIISVGVFSWAKRLVKSLAESRREKLPFRELSGTLQELAAIPPPVDSRAFYISLSDGFKGYLSRRLSDRISTYTSREVVGNLKEQFQRVPQLILAAQAMPFFDQMKFGGRQVSSAQRRRDIDLVMEAATAVEEHILESTQRQRGDE